MESHTKRLRGETEPTFADAVERIFSTAGYEMSLAIMDSSLLRGSNNKKCANEHERACKGS